MVQKELSLHEIEWEVMERPSQNGCTDLVVEALEGDAVVVTTRPLPSEDSKSLERDVKCNCGSRAQPDEWVTDQVDLQVVFTPEVDTAAKDWPRRWARIPCVRLNKAGVGGPHDLLELPELAEETRMLVVDLLSALSQRRVLVAFNVPDTVWQCTALGTSDFLLLKSPIWKLDLVREKNTASHDVDKLEFGLDRAQPFLCSNTIGHWLDNLNAEKVVSITLEAFVAVGRHFVLPFGFTDWWSHIVRVKSSVRGNVVKLED